MKIGIKYCGGCNLAYDRGKYVGLLIAEHKEIQFDTVLDNSCYDIILTINGCHRDCAQKLELNGKRKYSLRSTDDFDKISRIIKGIVSKNIGSDERK